MQTKKEYHKKYYIKNREKILSRMGVWRENNPNYGKQYYEKTHKSKKRSNIERFNKFTKINNKTGCIEWVSSKIPSGYGRISYKGKNMYAHRFSFLIHIGDIPEGKQVCHTCDNRSCVNPTHLWLGTIQENLIDRDNKKRVRNSFM